MRNKPECKPSEHEFEEHGDEDTKVCVVCGLLMERRCEYKWVKAGFVELEDD